MLAQGLFIAVRFFAVHVEVYRGSTERYQLAATKTCLINELKERKDIELNLESFCEYSVPLAQTQLTTV